MPLVKIFTVDFYISPPVRGLDTIYSEFRGAAVSHVPVIRIFGSTENGTKTCLHIHGVFPYLYIPFDGSEHSNSIMYKIATKLDQSINTALGQTTSNAQHVYKIVLVSGIPFYGYHPQEHQFLKIYFYNPLIMRKASNLLQNRDLLGNTYQLHEAHIPFVLQFMIDYNLHGMNYISLSHVLYRKNSNISQSEIPFELYLPSSVSKISTSEIEMDGLAENIVNRLEVISGQIAKNPGIAALWEDERQRRRNKNEISQISPCMSQSRVNVTPTESHIQYQTKLIENLKSISNNSANGDHNKYIYPIESDTSKHILSASFVVNHSPHTSAESFKNNENLSNDTVDLNNTFNSILSNDTDAKDLLDVLHDLKNEANVEEDCVLSQMIKNEEESDEENEIDMSLPLAAVTTPIKEVIDEDDNLQNDDTESQQIIIPQLDGTHDNDEVLNKRKKVRKKKSAVETKINSDNQLEFRNKNNLSNSKLNESLDVKKKTTLNKKLKVKRKLGFQETFVEEEMECRYKRNNYDKPSITQISNEKASKEKAISDSHPVASGRESPEIFSDELSNEPVENDKCKNNEFNLNMENFDHLTKAEEYDISKNYMSVAGPSKIFRISQKSSSQNTSSSSSFPYYDCSGQSMLQSERNFNSNATYTVHQLTQNLTLFEPSQNYSDSVLGSHTVLVPKFNPPSRKAIESSMREHNLPLVRHQVPFYSDFADLTDEVQVGHRILKIETNTSNLPEFECSSVERGLQHFRKLQLETMYPDLEITNSKLKCMKYLFCKNSDCVITTAKLPPSRKEVELWLEQQDKKSKEKVVKKKEKQKILLPCSPGMENDSDNDDSMTISPFTPTDEKINTISTESSEDIMQTPKSSLEVDHNLIGDSKRTKRNRKRSLCSEFLETCVNEKQSKNTLVLRKTLLQSQFLNNLLTPAEHSGRVSGATLNNTHGFRMSLENLQKAKSVTEHENLTTMIMELHIQTRADLRPDPQYDQVRAVFYTIFIDSVQGNCLNGIIAVDTLQTDANKKVPILNCTGVACDVIYVDSEINLLHEFIKFMQKWDPDICAGYEVEQLSWGYLIERGYVLGVNLQSSLSRTQVKLNFSEDDTNLALKLTGRIILDVWRLMRHEIALQSYTFENIVYHILHKRVPLYSFKDLSFWWEHKSSLYRYRTAEFYLSKVKSILQLLEQLDLIGRTCELARLFGIQFYEVLSRGSQFRVESMMLRLAKPLNYIPVSPSVQQRAKMKAPEYLPLILEPESKFFVDPVIVLDFQSLYPSMIIAYNYCFCTCLGRVEYLGRDSSFEFGATQLRISRNTVKKLIKKDLLNFSPCGVAFVKPQVREGILPRMLSEILDTRLMVKKSMKQNKENKLLQRVLHSRQLGLKLIANVTYGYTAANFSGRMPAVELGDSVVSKGRETLLRAIKLIENTPEWGAKVVYGDTDSVFVLVPGQSRETAFKIGQAIADAVTNDNPSPVKLKLEKVYHPCILQTKKRYVGYKYESPEQTEPEFCAKGIETVRRDGCPAVSKMLEKCLKILFDTKDVSLVRKYVQRQFSKILNGQASLQDLIFAKEYRGASNYRPGACVPVLELTRRWLSVDKRSEPRRGERVPYVIVNGHPGLPIIKLVRSPRELLSNSSLSPNTLYYITRVIIPPLNRCFNLIGADLNVWFKNMPKKQIQLASVTPDSSRNKNVIFHYFASTNCISCGQQTQENLCPVCCNSPQETAVILQTKMQLWERSYIELNQICSSCCGYLTNTPCISLDCPVLYNSIKANRNFQQVSNVQEVLSTKIDLEF